MRSLLWFRGRDLRLEDQPAVAAAMNAQECLPLVVLDPARGRNAFRTAFHRQALSHLDEELRARGSRLVVGEGEAELVVQAFAERYGVDRVEVLARVEPGWREVDAHLEVCLGGRLRVHAGDTLLPPGSLRTAAGGMYGVFTPFARAFARQTLLDRPRTSPRILPPLPPEAIAEPAWIGPRWNSTPDSRLQAFLSERLEGYRTGRNILAGGGAFPWTGPGAAGGEGAEESPASAGSKPREWGPPPCCISRMSADLRAGSLSARSLWHAVGDRFGQGYDEDIRAYQNELLWREFAHHTLWERPELAEVPFRSSWQAFPWREDTGALEAWKIGATGYPVVDAAARELLATGFVHNRARMVAASFLAKHLLLDWRLGERHYREHLVDGCAAANSLNWQWSAGCGVDAQPWFRLFHPTLQGQKYDPTGAYVRHWIPELRSVPDCHLFTPHTWGRPLDYPEPIVNHAMARARFLSVAKSHLG